MTGFQLFFLVVFTSIVAFDSFGPQIYIFRQPVLIGWLCGLVYGDVTMGLYIGGTIQLMSMGVVGLAGASVPNYAVATLVAVPIAITTGAGYEIGLAIGIPVAMLCVQLDIMKKITNSFIGQMSQRYCNKGEFKKMTGVLYLSVILELVKYLLPVLLFVLIGSEVVDTVLDSIPGWFMGGLEVAGKILPVVGIAILLNYMPAKKHINYLIIGFVAYAYLGVPMFGCALVGFALAYKFYKDKVETMVNPNNTSIAGGLEDE